MIFNSNFTLAVAWVLFTFVPLIAALPAHYQKTCTDYTKPVNVTSSNLIWAKPFANNYNAVDF
jgi:hypothetical protein